MIKKSQNRWYCEFLVEVVAVFTFTIVFSLQAFSQRITVNVPGDIPPSEGNLNNAVEEAITAGTLSNTVFNLEPNGYYILRKTITVPAGEHLTIVAPEPGQTQETAPPQIVWTSADDADTKFNFECNGDITLKNIWLLYANIEGQQVGSSLQINDNPEANASGKGEIGIFDGVIFDYARCPANYSGAVGVTAQHFKGTFRHCYFRNCIDPHERYYGRAVSFPYNSTGWHIDSLSFENCTFANIGCVYSQELGEYADVVHFNHCTFLNTVIDNPFSGCWYWLSVTNSIFVNSYMYGDFPADRDHEKIDSRGGTVRIDSVVNFGFEVPFTESDRHILFANSSYFIEEWLSTWMYNNPYSIDQRLNSRTPRVPQPQPMMSPGTFKFFDSDSIPYINKASLFDSTDPGFLFSPANIEAIKMFLYYRWNTSSDTNWAYFPELSVRRIWPLNENLAYINQTLLTAGMNGFPLGDLYHWFPGEYTQWRAQENEEHARISHWLNTGIDTIIVSIQEESGGAIPSGFSLSQNYPNPFNPTTRINYSIPRDGYISIKIYDLLGNEIAALFDGIKPAGDYTVAFDGTELASGVYLYQLKANNFIETKKLILLR